MSNIPVIHITPPFFFAEKSIHNKCFLAYSKDVETYRGDSLYALKKFVHAIHMNNPSSLPEDSYAVVWSTHAVSFTA